MTKATGKKQAVKIIKSRLKSGYHLKVKSIIEKKKEKKDEG